jgi:hypothetical protein
MPFQRFGASACAPATRAQYSGRWPGRQRACQRLDTPRARMLLSARIRPWETHREASCLPRFARLHDRPADRLGLRPGRASAP